jgi:hypothetical protein
MPTPILKELTDTAAPKPDDGSSALPLEDASYDPSKAPVVEAVSSGKVPGVLFSLADIKRPEIAPLVKNSRKLVSLGLGVYTNPTKKIAALFNPDVVTLDEIKKVDAAGKLDKLLKMYSAFSGGASGDVETVDTEQPAEADSAPKTVITNPGTVIQPPVAQAPKGVQTAASKVKPRYPAPTKQTAPGAGILLNSLL